jgi:hypothetical protein
MRIQFDMEMANRRSWRRHLATRIVDLPALPRRGDQVVVSPGGWCEPVREVWWELDKGEVHVELGPDKGSRCVEFDQDGEDLRKIAREAGWVVS